MEAIEGLGALFLFIALIFVLLLAILSILMPYFVYRIHQNISSINNKLDSISEKLKLLIEIIAIKKPKNRPTDKKTNGGTPFRVGE